MTTNEYRRLHNLCNSCGRKPRPQKKTCSKCARRIREANAARRADSGYYEKTKAWNRTSRRNLKIAVFNAYGGPVCSCCGEEHLEFLTLDHLEPPERCTRKLDRRCSSGLYSWLKKNGFPPGFRVLCMNCNFAEGHFGYCPHNMVEP